MAADRQQPFDYSRPFWIETAVGNNALSFSRRGPTPRIHVPSLIEGSLADVRPGEHIVFEDVDEHGVVQSCRGLEHFVRTTCAGRPAVIVDNHNHAFYFWCEAMALGLVPRGATLVHVDQHRDTRVPDRPYAGHSLREAFAYTNFHLNVGNFIVPARRAGLIGDVHMVTGEAALDLAGGAPDEPAAGDRAGRILDIDLDFFAPEMAYIDFERVRRFIEAQLPRTGFITVATSPFFIAQDRAIERLHALFD